MFTLLFVIGIICICIGSDWERSERYKDERHREIMEIEKKKLNQKKRTRTRTVMRDSKGRFAAQESISEEIEE